jgi:hypothetical protein
VAIYLLRQEAVGKFPEVWGQRTALTCWSRSICPHHTTCLDQALPRIETV